jgi:hypothetical protein
MRIRLTRKLADAIDGVVLSDYAVGDVIDLAPHEARLLIAEEWAVAVTQSERREVRQSTIPDEVAHAADSAPGNAVEHLRRATRLISELDFERPHGRRREDVLLDELHDAHPRTLRDTDEH